MKLALSLVSILVGGVVCFKVTLGGEGCKGGGR